MSEIGGGGYHWQAEAYAKKWDERTKAIAAERNHAFEEMLAVLPVDATAPLRVLDIGAGDGKVARVILERYQNAEAVLIDFSDPMMRKGREELACFGDRFRYVSWDMNDGPWPAEAAGPFDAVVSAAAIHHLQNERKAWLAKQVAARLANGGVFANYDLFRDLNAVFSDDEVHDRTCASLEEAISFLQSAGFRNITVQLRTPRPQRKGEVALLIGSSP